MPFVEAPWRTGSSDPGHPGVALATSWGELHCTGASYWGAYSNGAEVWNSVPAPPNAKGCNVYLRPPLHINEGWASAFGFLGYQAAAVELALFAREGGRKGEIRKTVARATSAIIIPAWDVWDVNRPFEFPEPLFFERPGNRPGSVEVGLHADCFSGGGGVVYEGSGCALLTNITRMEVEWLWW